MRLTFAFLVLCAYAATLIVADQKVDDVSDIKGNEGRMMPRRSVRSKTTRNPTSTATTVMVENAESTAAGQTTETPVKKASRRRTTIGTGSIKDAVEDGTASSSSSPSSSKTTKGSTAPLKKSQKTTTVKAKSTDKSTTATNAKSTAKPTTTSVPKKTTTLKTTTKVPAAKTTTLKTTTKVPAAKTTTLKTTTKPTTVKTTTLKTTTATTKTTLKPTVETDKPIESETTMFTTTTNDFEQSATKTTDSQKEQSTTGSTMSATTADSRSGKVKRDRSNSKKVETGGWQLLNNAAKSMLNAFRKVDNDSTLAAENVTASFNATEAEQNVTANYSETGSTMVVSLSTSNDAAVSSESSEETKSSLRMVSAVANETNNSASSMVLRMNAGFLDTLNNMTAQNMIDYIDRQVMVDVYNSSWDGFEMVIKELRTGNSYGEFSYEFLSSNSANWSFHNGHSDLIGSYNCTEMDSDSSTDQSNAADIGVYSGLYVGYLSNVQAYAVINFSLESDNLISAEIVECNLTSVDLDFVLSKKEKYRNPHLREMIESELLPLYSSIICDFFDTILNQSMTSMNLYYDRVLPIGSDSPLYLNASFADAPQMNVSYVDILLNGEVQGVLENEYRRENVDESNCNGESDRCVFIGDYTVNTLLYQGFYGQLFNEPGNDTDNPAHCVGISLSEPPVISTSATNSTIVISGAVTSSFNESEIDDLHFNATGLYRPQINNNQLYGVVSQVKTVLSKAGYDSVIGCLNWAVQQTMNAFFSEYRIPIPKMQYANWVNSTVGLSNRTQVVQQDLSVIF